MKFKGTIEHFFLVFFIFSVQNMVTTPTIVRYGIFVS